MAKSKSSPPKAESPPPKAPEAKKEAKKTSKVWNCNLYIRDHGQVWEGEEATAEAMAKVKNPDQYVD